MKTYTIKSFFISILLINAYFTALGQNIDFVDTLFVKRLNSLNLQIELPYNDTVEENIKRITRQNANNTAKSIGAFLEEKEYIDSVLKAAGLPKELQYLPLAISKMNPYAENKFHCAGIWQLPHLIAVAYGLEVNKDIDERYDIKKSTLAAAEYLKTLSEKHADLWEVIIVYSNGAAAMNAAKIRANQNKNVWNLYAYGNLPNKDIIPDFITSVYIANFYQSHRIQPIAPEKGKDIFPRNTVESPKPAPPKPANTNTITVQSKPKITYTIKSGDTLSRIAAIYKVSIDNLKKWNGLKSDRINIGQKLIIYR